MALILRKATNNEAINRDAGVYVVSEADGKAAAARETFRSMALLILGIAMIVIGVLMIIGALGSSGDAGKVVIKLGSVVDIQLDQTPVGIVLALLGVGIIAFSQAAVKTED